MPLKGAPRKPSNAPKLKVLLRGNSAITPVLYKLFMIRPPNGSEDPFETNTEFCLYDETHNDYVYEDAWVEFLVHFLQTTDLSADQLRTMEKEGISLNVEEHRI